MLWSVAALAGLTTSCGTTPKSTAPEAVHESAAKPEDETRRFPLANRVNTEVVDSALIGKAFMPGGTLAHYKQGRTEYDMFIARLPGATDASLLLLDWHKALSGAKLIPSFGGYFGLDGTRPVFVFSKGSWIAGIVGLTEKQSDTAARSLAAHLDF
jgi:hypothetical protein